MIEYLHLLLFDSRTFFITVGVIIGLALFIMWSLMMLDNTD